MYIPNEIANKRAMTQCDEEHFGRAAKKLTSLLDLIM